MMRVICLLLVSLFALKVNAQQYTKFNGYGFQADRLKADSVSIHPSDTIRNKAARSIAVLNGVFYIADGTKWKVVGTDTTSISNRINLRVKYTDTATMLSPYLRTANYSPVDTIALSNRINLKLNIADSSSMLSPYIRNAGFGLTKSSQTLLADSLVLSTRAWRQKGIDSVAAIELNISDTATMLTPYTIGSGTSGQVAYWNATRSLTGSSGFTFTPTTSLLLNNSVTAASAIARGANLTPTLTAAANSDVLVGLDINPTFTNGSFTGVQNTSIRTFLINNTSMLGRNGLLINDDNLASNGGYNFLAWGVSNQPARSSGIRAFWLSNNGFEQGLSFHVASGGNGALSAVVSSEAMRITNTKNLLIGTTTDAGYKLDVNGTARITGNLFTDAFLAIGTSINAWGSFTSALQIGGSSTYASLNNITYIGNNTFFSAAWKYISTAASARMEIQDGFKFFIAPSGTAGTNITFTQPMTINSSGNVLIGTTTNAASSKLTVESTTQGFLPPRMTTTQKNAISSPATGLVIYDTTLNKLCVRTASAWETITSL
jgi:hypothetical protein